MITTLRPSRRNRDTVALVASAITFSVAAERGGNFWPLDPMMLTWSPAGSSSGRLTMTTTSGSNAGMTRSYQSLLTSSHFDA
jgi:hypothetical protein